MWVWIGELLFLHCRFSPPPNHQPTNHPTTPTLSLSSLSFRLQNHPILLFSYIISSQWPLASSLASSHRVSRSTRSSNLVSHLITEQPDSLLCSDLTRGQPSRSQKEEERRTRQQAAWQESPVERAGSRQSAERETWQQSVEHETRQSGQPHWRCKGINLSRNKAHTTSHLTCSLHPALRISQLPPNPEQTRPCRAIRTITNQVYQHASTEGRPDAQRAGVIKSTSHGARKW